MVIKLVDESNGVGDAFLLHGDGAGMIRNADDLEAFLRAENNFATLTQIASNPIARTRAISQGFANACVMHRCPLPTPPDETQSRPRCARPLLLRAAAVLSPARARTQLKTSRAQAVTVLPHTFDGFTILCMGGQKSKILRTRTAWGRTLVQATPLAAGGFTSWRAGWNWMCGKFGREGSDVDGRCGHSSRRLLSVRAKHVHVA